MSMLSLSALSLLLAVSAPGPTQAPPTAAAPFARVYKLKEQLLLILDTEKTVNLSGAGGRAAEKGQ